jgi:hypothetical protein
VLKALQIALILATFTCSSLAQQESGVWVMGAGNDSCGKYLEVRKGNSMSETNLYVSWVLGYLSAYNMYTNQKDARVPDAESMVAFLDLYCRNNPLNNVLKGAWGLIGELGGNHLRSIRR